MTRWDLTALAINTVIGSGIFVLPSSAARLLGAWGPVGLLLCAAIIYIVVLCFAEVSSHFNRTGGPYLYAREAFGPFVGFEIGWTMWLARVSAFAANSIVLVSYVSFFFPQTAAGIGRVIVLVAATAVITIINVRGVADGALFGGVFAAVKVAALLSFVTIGIAFVDWQRVAPSGSPFAADVKWGQGLLLLLYAYMGFESLGTPAAEAKNPRKDLPAAWLAALGIYASIYITAQIVAFGTVSDLASSERPLADSARTFLGPAAGSLMSLLVCISVVGNLSAIALLTPRITFALAEHGQCPAVLGKLHRTYRTPAVSIVLFGAVAAILALSGTFVWLATVSVIARLASFITTCLALPVLRKRLSEPPRFKIRWGPAVAAAGILLCVWLMSRAQSSDLRAFGIAAGAGALLYGAAKISGKASS